VDARLLIRADATEAIGTGHVMRCLALAQAWKDAGGAALFISALLPEAIERRIRREGFEIEIQSHAPGSADDAHGTGRAVRRFDPDWIVCDGYAFGTDFQARMRRTGAKLLVVDDYAHLPEYDADVILNQNLGADRLGYPARSRRPELLLGPRYALLRREIREEILSEGQDRESGLRLVVTMGGADPGNASAAVLANLRRAAEVGRLASVVVLLGPANRWQTEVEAACEAFTGATGVAATPHFDPPELPDLLRSGDLAVSAAGSTCWEFAYFGIPMLLLVTAENQRMVATNIQAAGFGIDAGEPSADMPGLVQAFDTLACSPSLRSRMSHAARRSVDGRGVLRVREALEGLRLHLRTAQPDDVRFLFELVNDEEVRRQSFLSGAISWEGHQEWFLRKLDDPRTQIYIALEGDTPVGQLRLDCLEAGQAEIDYSVVPQRRGSGLAKAILRRGTRRAFRELAVNQIVARVKPKNDASRKALTASGFEPHSQGSADVDEKYILLRSDA
jgi:UDP-2,4-diacetamido-2,4,6-trideoxy-beta-L-altropyranose hydrolase